MIGGTYTLVQPHPSSTVKRSLTFSPGSSSNLLSGNLTVPLGLSIKSLPGSEQVDEILDKVTGAMDLITDASKAAGLHLDFLEKKLGPLVKIAKDLLGSFDRFGTISLSLDIPLPLSLEISLSISFDFSTGKLNIAGSLGFGGGGPAPGTLLPTQALPLSSEGGFSLGGIPKSKTPGYTVKEETLNITTTTIYTKYPSLYSPVKGEAYTPVGDSTTIPYVLVSRDHNNLDFSNRPSEALASFLTKNGVINAGTIVDYLDQYVNNGDLFSFLFIATELAQSPKDKVIISVISDVIGGGSSGSTPFLREEIDKIEKPSSLSCPKVSSEVIESRRLVELNQADDSIAAIEDYFMEVLPDPINWVEGPDKVIEWLENRDYPFYPAMKELAEGNLYEFLVLTTFITTGLDLEAYENTEDTLKALFNASYPLPKVGV
jgi:hypothetical protein